MNARGGSTVVSDGDHDPGGFRHEAFLYAGEDEFLTGTASFIRDGLLAGQPTLVAVLPAKIDRLRAELDHDADLVSFADMAEVGRNPARIIAEWRRFVDATKPGVKIRGIGEPIWSARGAAELVESQLHEILLNVAFPDSPPLWLLCPYDTAQLEAAVIEEARHSHPFLLVGRCSHPSPEYRDPNTAEALLADALPPLPQGPGGLLFEAWQLADVRARVSAYATYAGLSPSRADDLVVAVDEVATNSTLHGGGWGVLHMWEDGDSIICEVIDEGYVNQPLAGRSCPRPEQDSGRGLWLANNLCDLVQLRSSPRGTTVRLHMARQ